MATLLQRECGACGKFHELCLADADTMTLDATYEYVCPTTGDFVRVAATEWSEIASVCPVGAVTMRLAS